MLQTNVHLKNAKEIEKMLKELVTASYEEIKKDGYLLCMECGDVDLYVAASYHEDLQNAINQNFELDEFGEPTDREKYHELMDDLSDYFITLHIESGLFDFFPAGIYEIQGEKRQSETDMLAPKGKYYAPFEDAHR